MGRLVVIRDWFVEWYPGDLDMTWWETRLMWRWRLHGWITCRLSGHDWYPDHCGRREHDLCERCQIQRGAR
jgi:hypothetical protein